MAAATAVAAEVVVADAEAAINTITNLPRLGVGFGFRDRYHTDVFVHRSSIDFLEITADHFFDASRAKREQLELLSRNFTLIPHGLSLSLGSAEGIDDVYLRQLADIVSAVSPPWWSEHIAFTHAGGIDIGHLTSLPRTKESLAVLGRNIRRAKAAIPMPLILENITESIRYPGDQIDEASFLGELLEENDCGLLLDVTNLYTNSVNYRFDPLPLLWRLPRERIVQLHFAGGHWQDETLIDSHSTPACEEVWSLLREVLAYADVRGIILERDEKLPPLTEILIEVNRAREMYLQAKSNNHPASREG
jgi:uncharacterized protein (UPF0276 family)